MESIEKPLPTDADIFEAFEWNEIIDSVAGRDDLTKLPNRNALTRAFERESMKAVRHNRPLTALFLDIDNFKLYNDTYGHTAGDKVLISLAQVLKENTRKIDVPSRYGGEEFMVLLPETDIDKAMEVAERIRLGTVSDLAKGQLVTNGNNKILKDVTISVGVARWREKQSFDDFIHSVDSAMYDAKKEGRNRVVGITENNKMIKYGDGWLK